MCLEKELSLEMLRRETMCSLCSVSEERRRPPRPPSLVLCEDRCSLTGFFPDVPTCAPLSYAVCLLRCPAAAAAASSAAVRDGGGSAATLSTTLRRDTVAKEAGGAVLEWKGGTNNSSITTSCICRCPHSTWEIVGDITVKSP